MALRRLGIGTRGIVAAVVALALTALAFGLALVATAQGQSRSSELAQRLVPASIAADDLLSNLAAQQNRLRDAVTEGRPGGLALFAAREADVDAYTAQVARFARGDPAMTARLGAVTAAHQAWLVNVADPQAAALRRGDVAAAAALQADTAHVSPYVFNLGARGVALRTQIAGEQQAATGSLSQAHDLLIGALIAMIVAAVGVAAWVIVGAWRGVLRPLASALAERERAEQNLRRLFDLMPDAVLGVTRDGLIVTANAQAVETFGYPADELVGRRVETLVPEGRRADLAARAEAYFADERSRAQWNAATWSMLRSDGTEFPCGVRLSALPAETGMLIVVAVRDGSERVAIEAESERLRAIAEQERLQGKLRQFQRLESLGQLVGGVAHDFNNLLGIISGYAEYTVEQLQPLAKEDARLVPLIQDIEQVQSAAQQAIRVTRQLLTFAKSKPASTELLDVNEVVNSAGQLLRRSLGAKIELVIAADADLWPVEADRGQLEQVLVNLALNARDAMPDGGRLTITTANAKVEAGYAEQRPGLKPGRYCRLAVADTGTGMDAETIERVFEPFFSTKPRGRGTGLGLATAYGAVSGTGGIIDINSEKGFGTTMSVLLPVAGQATEAVPEPSPAREQTRGHGEAILLVEDERNLRSMAARILTRNGYQVREAVDGPAAIRLASDPDERVDLLLTDVVMPGMLGNEVVDRVCGLRPGLPALYVTGHPRPVLDFHGIRAPDLDIVQKPFTEAVLLGRVRRALDKARQGAPT